MKNFLIIIGAVILLGSVSCQNALFVKKTRYVQNEQGYLILYQKVYTKIDTSITQDPDLEKVGFSNEVRSFFIRTKVDTSYSKQEILKKIWGQRSAYEFGEFCERNELIMQISDTLAIVSDGIFHYIPADIDFVKTRNLKTSHKVILDMQGHKTSLAISDAPRTIIQVRPVLSSDYLRKIKSKSRTSNNVD